jgi:hypothetical protein
MVTALSTQGKEGPAKALPQIGVRGFEPRTSWSQTMRATHCATPRQLTGLLAYTARALCPARYR